MAYTTKGFFMPSDDPEKEELARLYTASTFQLSKDIIRFPQLFYIEEKEKWAYRNIDGYDTLLNEEEVIRLVGCRMCGKPKVNNWRRYCSSECPYYFNTPALKEIVNGKRK